MAAIPTDDYFQTVFHAQWHQCDKCDGLYRRRYMLDEHKRRHHRRVRIQEDEDWAMDVQ